MSMRRDTDASERITGSGPLADPGVVTGGPIDDPTLADRNNPRWSEGGEATMPMPDAPPIGGPGSAGGDIEAPRTIPQSSSDLPDPQGDALGGPDMMATAPVAAALADLPVGGSGSATSGGPAGSAGPAPRSAGAVVEETGTPQDQAAQPLDGLLESGTDNIREGRGDVQSNPALAEGGDNG